MNPRNQSFVVTFLLIVAAVAMIVMAVQNESKSQDPLTINEVAQDIKEGKVSRVVIENNGSLRVIYGTGDENKADSGLEAYKESGSTLVEQLLSLGVTPEQLAPQKVMIEVKAPSMWEGAFGGFLV